FFVSVACGAIIWAPRYFSGFSPSYSSSPAVLPPLDGEGRGGVEQQAPWLATPTLNPSPQGGGRRKPELAVSYSAATRGGVSLSTSLSKSSTLTTRSVASSAARMIPASLSLRTPATTASAMASRSMRRSMTPLRAALMKRVSISSASVTLTSASSSTPVTSLGSLEI